MLRLSGTTSFALVFGLALCANPLFAQGQSVLQPDVELIANGGAFEFDGSGPGMNLGSSSVLDVSGGDFTIHAWVRFASLINGGPCYGAQCDMAIAEKISGEYNSSGWRLLKWSDGHFYFCLGGGSANGCDASASTTVVSETVAVTDVWYGVVGVKTADQISIYVNGVLEGTKDPGEYFDASDAPFLVGSNRSEHSFLVGEVGQVQLFKSALSESDVRTLYNASERSYEAQKQTYEFITIDPPGSVDTIARAVNAQGDIVGQFKDKNGQTHAFLWSNGSYRVLDVFGSATGMSAYGINARGDIVGWSNAGGWLLRRGTFISLGFGPAAINDAGDIVGGLAGHGILLSGGKVTQIDFPDACANEPMSINDAGDIVGQYMSETCDESTDDWHGFMLGRDGTFTKIDVPNSVSTVPFGINALGDVVGTYSVADGPIRGFLMRKGVFTDTDIAFPGASITRAFGISDRGWIVGAYRIVGGNRHGFLAIRK